MTLLNFTVADRQAAIVTDTGIFDNHRLVSVTTKAIALPHLRAVIAASGNSGLIVDWLTWLLLGYPVSDVEDLDQEAPALLRSASKHLGGRSSETLICHFGVTASDQIKAFKYSSESDWCSQIIQPNECWATPAPPPAASEVQPDRSAGAPAAHRSDCYLPTWSDRVGAIVDAAQRQARLGLNGHRVGGRVQVTFLTPEAIHQCWLAELPRPTE